MYIPYAHRTLAKAGGSTYVGVFPVHDDETSLWHARTWARVTARRGPKPRARRRRSPARRPPIVGYCGSVGRVCGWCGCGACECSARCLRGWHCHCSRLISPSMRGRVGPIRTAWCGVSVRHGCTPCHCCAVVCGAVQWILRGTSGSTRTSLFSLLSADSTCDARAALHAPLEGDFCSSGRGPFSHFPQPWWLHSVGDPLMSSASVVGH